jgi:hypothetical protein
MWYKGTKVSGDPAVLTVKAGLKRQQDPVECQNTYTKVHGVTFHKTTIFKSCMIIVNSSYYIVWHDSIFSEQWNGKDMEVTGYGLIGVSDIIIMIIFYSRSCLKSMNREERIAYDA